MKKLTGNLKKRIAGVFLAVLLISLFAGTASAGTMSAGTADAADDPLAGRAGGHLTAGFYSGGISLRSDPAGGFDSYSHNYVLRPYLKDAPGKIKRGIDVSSYQGQIDWAKVKADPAGIDFAVIRAGSRGYDASGSLNPDANLEQNLQGALEQGLNCGVYFFSQAVTVAEAQAEADYVIGLLQKNGVTSAVLKLPVFLDVEFAADSNGNPTGRLYTAKLTAAQQTDICNAFIQKIEAAGYEAGVYANKSMLTNNINAANLKKTAAVWLANYGTSTDYAGTYSYWQCTEAGQMDGITGNLDLNFYYEPENGSGYANAVPAETAILPRQTTEEVNIREYAGTDFVSLGKVPANTRIDILSAETDGAGTIWYETVYGSKTGYIHSGYTKPFADSVTGLKMSGQTTAAIALSWKKASCADGYVIERASSESGPYSAIATIRDPGTEAYSDTECKAGTFYYYRIRAFRKENGQTYYGAYSSVLTAATQVQMPKNFAQNIKKNAKNSITMKWKKVSGADGYQIYRSAAKNGKYKKVKTISKAGTLTWKDTKSLSAGTEYYYKIRAYKKVDGTVKYGDLTSAAAMHTKMSSRQNIRTKKKAVMRANAGTAYKKKVTVPKNTKFTVIYRTKDKAGKAWYKISYRVKKKTYTGYIPAAAAKKA